MARHDPAVLSTLRGTPAATARSEDHNRSEVRGARENNLRGVAGLINETDTAFLQWFMPSQSRPDVASLRNLSAAIVVDEERMGANNRSTVGTATDAYSMLRIIIIISSRPAKPAIGPSNLFVFNNQRA